MMTSSMENSLMSDDIVNVIRTKSFSLNVNSKFSVAKVTLESLIFFK